MFRETDVRALARPGEGPADVNGICVVNVGFDRLELLQFVFGLAHGLHRSEQRSATSYGGGGTGGFRVVNSLNGVRYVSGGLLAPCDQFGNTGFGLANSGVVDQRGTWICFGLGREGSVII